MSRKWRVASIFTGIGGMDLGLQRTDRFRIVSMCELDDFRRSVLDHHWPKIPKQVDIHDVKGSDLPAFDWLIGGPPCHRTSIAAAIHGKWTGETLWPQMYRIMKETKANGAIIEQPNRHQGWKETVERNLEESGYDFQKYVIKAQDVGAPHQRERVFYVAHRYGKRLALPRGPKPPEVEAYQRLAATGSHWTEVDARVLRMDDGVPPRMDEPPKRRKERIMAAGSSCVPQVGTILGMIIEGAYSAKK